jgi:pimeloyl-ACP methyl ester carboxylesterase
MGAAAQKALEAQLRQFATACQKADGAILPYVGTVDTARDLDRIRAAVGDATLTYMGQSYGTLLGATYAELFPTHVRAMVLDSAIDPSLSLAAFVLGQAEGFEAALQRFFAWCAATGSCPWRPVGNPETAVLALLAQVTEMPLPADSSGPAGPGALYDALLDGLYAQSDWPTLGNALGQAAGGNGSGLVAMADHYTTGGGTYAEDANVAINCLDYPASKDLSKYPALAAADAAQAPVFGALVAWGAASCAVWPVPASRTPGPVRAEGSPPILVVGTTGDPATPYQWAVGLAGQLEDGVLLTRDGDDHVAYFTSACVRSAVAAYLTAGTLPATGTVCTG